MKLYSKPIAEHPEAGLAHEDHFDLPVVSNKRINTDKNVSSMEKNCCYVVSIGTENDLSRQQAEIISLVKTQGDKVVGTETLRLPKPNPRTLIGKGKAKEIAQKVAECGADLLVLDVDLSPSQLRNLEDTVGIAVCDREAVILNVFRKHARTRRAKIQVEIAHLDYLRPRIRGLGLDMDQQAPGVIGSRGAGETASALLARKLDGRLLELRKALATIKKSAASQRAARGSCEHIALVGYTNAGKTSLMNQLTGTGLSAKDKPFETLDTTTRRLSGHGGDVLLSDTVGFIRRLPERLMESFESTLEGIQEASLLVLVVDISDPERELHIETTMNLLAKLGAKDTPRLYVFNKTDLLDQEVPEIVLSELSHGCSYITLSCHDQEAVTGLRQRLLDIVRSEDKRSQVHVPYDAGALLSMIYGQCRVISTTATDTGLTFVVEGTPGVLAKIKKKATEVCHA